MDVQRYYYESLKKPRVFSKPTTNYTKYCQMPSESINSRLNLNLEVSPISGDTRISKMYPAKNDRKSK